MKNTRNVLLATIGLLFLTTTAIGLYAQDITEQIGTWGQQTVTTTFYPCGRTDGVCLEGQCGTYEVGHWDCNIYDVPERIVLEYGLFSECSGSFDWSIWESDGGSCQVDGYDYPGVQHCSCITYG